MAAAAAAAAAAESFSIREYAASMRSLDFGKCWPFGGGGGEGESLPPMPIRKFCWWSDELAAATPTAAPLTPEEEGRQSRSAGRAKQRTPKKRSIVELFAVAPQIDAVEEEADGCEGEEGGGGRDEDEKLDKDIEVGAEQRSGRGLAAGDGGGGCSGDLDKVRRRKEKVKGDENGGKMRKMYSMAPTKKKKAKKQQRLQIKIRVAKKEKACKPRVKSSLSISQLLQEVVCKRMFRKSLKVTAHNKRKKPPSVKVVLEKPNPNPKLFRSKQKVARKDFPVHSILKKKTNTSFTTKACSTNGVEAHYPQKSSCDMRKHVTFSGKDDILGKEDGTPGTPNTQSLCHTSSDISTESGTRHVRNEGDKPAYTENSLLVNERGTVVAPAPVDMTDTRRPAASVDATVSNANIPDKEKPILSASVGLNHVTENSNLNCLNSNHSDLSSCQSYLGNRAALSGVHAEQCCHMTLDVTRGLLVPMSSSSETCSQAIAKNRIPQPSKTSCLVTNFDLNEKKDSLVEGKRNSNCHLLGVQPRPHLSHKEVLSSISSSTGSNKSTDTRLTTDYMSSCRNFCLGEDYIGLPLNSQGELIRMHSGATFSPNELFNRQDMVKCFSGSFPVHGHIDPNSSVAACANIRGNPAAPFYWSDNLGWYRDQYSPIMPITSGLGFVQLPGFERMEIYEPIRRKDLSLHHGQYLMSLSHSGCRQHDHQAQNTLRKEKCQMGHGFNKEAKPATEPTMRLMGQTVKVGNTSKECACSDNGKVWTDKDIIAESSRSVMKSSTSPYRSPQAGVVARRTSGTSKEDRVQPLGGVQSSHYNIPAVEMRFDSMHFGHQPHYGPHPRVMLNKTSMPNMNTITRHSEVGHQMPYVAGQHQNISPHMLLNSTHCKHSQSSCFSTSTSNPHKYGSFVELTPAQPSTCLPHWLLHAKQKTQKSSFQTYRDSTSVHHPCFMSGIRLPSIPSTHPPALSFPVSNNIRIQPCGSTPVHRSFAPPYPTINPTAVSASDKNKDDERNELKSKFAMLKSIDWTKKNKKRHAESNDGFSKPSKKPHLTDENDLNAPMAPSEGEDLSGCKSFGRAPEMPPGSKLAEMGVRLATNEMNDSVGATSALGGRKLGPVKLSAGAKHVLKPSPNVYQGNSRPIHSTMPLVVGTSSKMDFSQKKTAEIYRF